MSEITEEDLENIEPSESFTKFLDVLRSLMESVKRFFDFIIIGTNLAVDFIPNLVDSMDFLKIIVPAILISLVGIEVFKVFYN